MWKSVKLGDVLSLQNGYAFKSKEYLNDGYFIMRITNVQQGFISTHNPKYVRIEDNSKFSKFVLSEGDILVSLTGDVGRVGVIKEEHLPAALNQRVARITDVKASYLDSNFLFIYLNSELFRKQVENFAHGAAQANVSTKDILSIELSLPPLEEQHRIVAKLDTALAEIDRAVIITNKQYYEYTKLFTQAVDSFLDAGINSGWRQCPVVEVCESVIDCVNKTAPIVNEKTAYKMLRTTNIRNGKVDTSKVRYVDEQTFYTWTRRQVPKLGDVILTREAPMGEVGMLVNNENVFLGQRLVSYRVNAELLDNYFLLYVLQSSMLQKQIKSKASGATVQHMRVPHTKELVIPVPSLAEQKEISKKLNSISNRLNKYEGIISKKLNNLEKLKSAILSQELQSDAA